MIERVGRTFQQGAAVGARRCAWLLPFWLASFLLAATTLVGCDDDSEAPERGKPTRSERQLEPGFSGVAVPGKVHVVPKKGATTTATLEGPSNYLQDIALRYETRSVDGKKIKVLLVDLSGRVQPPRPKVELSLPQLDYVHASGAAQVEVHDFASAAITLQADGAAKIELQPGSYGTLVGVAKMAGRIVGEKVLVEEARLRASGASFIRIGQAARLRREVIPDGKISVGGDPELLQ